MTSEHEPLDLVLLPGSERPPAIGAQPASAGAIADERDGEHPVEATVVLRRRTRTEQPAKSGETLDRTAFAASWGADPADIELAVSTFQTLGLTIVSADQASRRIRISGSIETVSRVFGTELSPVSSEGASGRVAHRHRTGSLSIPAALDGVVTAVLGLDDRPQARAQFRVARAHAASASYTPVQLGEIYRFPAGTDGTGQTIAIIELGGGYQQSDLDTYFSELGVGSPSVTAVGVDGATNVPGGDPNGADGEVLLDIEVVGGLAPRSSIVVYFAPNTDAGFLDAVATAAHAIPTPAAISISWGQSEDQWTAQARNALDDALADAGMLGATVTAAAGDNGSTDGATDGRDHADFPASSPNALACGGTSLTAGGASVASGAVRDEAVRDEAVRNESVRAEAVWNEVVWNNGAGAGATGGGVSDVFPLPAWQSAAGVPARAGSPGGRGVPDVAANADPNTGYQVLVDGSRAVYGGTSAVAPLWAALIARMVQSLGTPLGLLHPRLYAVDTGFRDVTAGTNGTFAAGPGWDACTGLGVPDGEKLLAALRRPSNA